MFFCTCEKTILRQNSYIVAEQNIVLYMLLVKMLSKIYLQKHIRVFPLHLNACSYSDKLSHREFRSFFIGLLKNNHHLNFKYIIFLNAKYDIPFTTFV